MSVVFKNWNKLNHSTIDCNKLENPPFICNLMTDKVTGCPVLVIELVIKFHSQKYALHVFIYFSKARRCTE